MASPFETAAALAEPGVATVFGESFAFTPMTRPVNGVAVADGARTAVAAFTALFDAGGALLDVGGRGTGLARTVSEAQIVFRTALTGTVKAGDRVTRAKTGAVYELRDPRPAGLGLTAALLALISP